MSGVWASGWTRHRVGGHGHRTDNEMKWEISEVKETDHLHRNKKSRGTRYINSQGVGRRRDAFYED